MNKLNKFTPGPWIVERSQIYSTNESHDAPICDVVSDPERKTYAFADGEAEANARLIAAAPEMYEALEAIDGNVSDRPDIQELINYLLAKVRGE